ncbi:hypothetical protein NSK_006687 [Nannochloropsis salina CCMP1776]|uniref:BZIP domain-containing protein n=1 Tax=Nannochloropsis salina CCMP1776 TaxID=1027361 RepID=A0A4D9CZV2_9STRA|nr:hypothetical protein NSK_006687 [Nannochloropsis salina CCMP1776]|eukprot:TFJ82019.1 hypothetical protein NSK_006687 [Nannochloropsis salina CCMP1776]
MPVSHYPADSQTNGAAISYIPVSGPSHPQESGDPSSSPTRQPRGHATDPDCNDLDQEALTTKMDEDEDEDEEEEEEEGWEDEESKRQKRLEQNRKAAHESRQRKKIKYQQLSEALEALRAESLQLSQQSQSMREQLAATRPTRHSQERARLEEENQRLRQALLLALQGLAEEEEDEPIEEEREDERGRLTAP